MREPGQPVRRGRRPGEPDTRGDILRAARRLFAERGFDRTTLREVARRARVDPALVGHYFGSKERLFLDAVELPFEPETVLPAVIAGDRDDVGRRVARFLVATLETPAARERITSIVRAAASEPAAAALVREVIQERVLAPVARALQTGDADLRAALAGSQVVGLVMARYVVGVEPLASLPPERLVAALAPTFQRYLAGRLGDGVAA
jgi:AcrR family transcriptional regulator